MILTQSEAYPATPLEAGSLDSRIRGNDENRSVTFYEFVEFQVSSFEFSYPLQSPHTFRPFVSVNLEAMVGSPHASQATEGSITAFGGSVISTNRMEKSSSVGLSKISLHL